MIRDVIKDAQQKFVQTYLLIIVATMKVKVLFQPSSTHNVNQTFCCALVGGAGDADWVVAVDGAFSEAV